MHVISFKQSNKVSMGTLNDVTSGDKLKLLLYLRTFIYTSVDFTKTYCLPCFSRTAIICSQINLLKHSITIKHN
jgi:hypothetical protein